MQKIPQLVPKKYAKTVLTDERAYLIHVFDGQNNTHPLFSNLTQIYGSMFVYMELDVS